MPFSAIGAYACKALQAVLTDYYGRNAAQYRTYGSVSTLRFLLSPQNTRNFRRIDIGTGIPGKKRPVAFMVDTPYCYELCTSDFDCETPKTLLQPASGELVFDLTDPPYRPCDGSGNPLTLFFDDADLEKYCTISDTTWVGNQIARYIARFEEAFDAQIAAILATNAGTAFNGDAITNLPFFVTNSLTGTSVINHDSMWYLDQNYNDIGGGAGQYALVGGKMLNKIGVFQRWVGLNDMGINLNAIPDLNPYLYYDRNMDTILGQTDFLQISPGAAQLVVWNRYQGEKARRVTDLYSHGTVTSPATGLDIDWKWRYDYDCEKWYFEASLHAELAVVPPGGCGTEGVNGIIRYHECSLTSLVPECPESPVT